MAACRQWQTLNPKSRMLWCCLVLLVEMSLVGVVRERVGHARSVQHAFHTVQALEQVGSKSKSQLGGISEEHT